MPITQGAWARKRMGCTGAFVLVVLASGCAASRGPSTPVPEFDLSAPAAGALAAEAADTWSFVGEEGQAALAVHAGDRPQSLDEWRTMLGIPRPEDAGRVP